MEGAKTDQIIRYLKGITENEHKLAAQIKNFALCTNRDVTQTPTTNNRD
jgi:hypothetical protein